MCRCSFGTTYLGKYSAYGIDQLYPSSNFYDDLSYAAAWLYRATGQANFLNDAENFWNQAHAIDGNQYAHHQTSLPRPTVLSARCDASLISFSIGFQPAETSCVNTFHVNHPYVGDIAIWLMHGCDACPLTAFACGLLCFWPCLQQTPLAALSRLERRMKSTSCDVMYTHRCNCSPYLLCVFPRPAANACL